MPKSDGGRCPLGVPTLEDEIVQAMLAEVAIAIYENDFVGFLFWRAAYKKSETKLCQRFIKR
jgi:retron-type reverse transcriptase